VIASIRMPVNMMEIARIIRDCFVSMELRISE